MAENNITNNVQINDNIDAARIQLVELDIITDISEDKKKFKLNLTRLHLFGYTLIINNEDNPVFVTNTNLHYMTDVNLYYDNEIPFESLLSYTLIQMKKEQISP